MSLSYLKGLVGPHLSLFSLGVSSSMDYVMHAGFLLWCLAWSRVKLFYVIFSLVLIEVATIGYLLVHSLVLLLHK